MPGILGIVSRGFRQEDLTSTLNRMAAPLRWVDSQELQVFSTDRCAGAAIGHGIRLEHAKSAMASRDGVHLWMDGEVFPEVGEVPAERRDRSPNIQRAEYCLDLYLRAGPRFVRTLNGTFAIAVFDTRDKRLHLYTDRFGACLLFVWKGPDECAFASSVRSLLRYRHDIGREYDRRAVAELTVFERVLGDRTLFTDIVRLTAGTHASLDGGTWSTSCYAPMLPRETPGDLRDWKSASRELLDRFRRSVAKRTSDGSKAAVMLSGGIDSRLVLAVSPPGSIAATLSDRGRADAPETHIATRAARITGTQHLLLERDSDYYARIAEEATEINEGLCTFVGCHSVGKHDEMAAAGIEVVLTGDRFDAAFKGYFSGDLVPPGLYPSPPASLQARRIARFLSEGPLVRRGERQDLMMLALTDEMKDVAVLAKECMIRYLHEQLSSHVPSVEVVKSLALRDWQAFTTMGFVRGLRTRFLERSPLFDNALADLSLSLPSSWCLRGRLVRHALQLAHPRLGRLRDINTGLPAGLCPPWDQWLDVVPRTAKALARRLARTSKFVASFRRSVPGRSIFTTKSWHDRNASLRSCAAYRRLVETVVEGLDPQFFDVATVRALLADDMNAPAPRLNHLFEILITFSLFDRKWGPRSRPAS